MAGQDRQETQHLAELIEKLAGQPSSVGFFEALRLIECLYPNSPRLGTSRRPAEDPVRLAQQPAMSFESASLTSFEPREDDRPYRLTVRLFGLLGPNGPLPLHLTDYAQERIQKFKDPTFSRFLDVFHHRMLSLFYRAWANNEPTVSYDRPDADRFADYVGSLSGLGMPTLMKRDEISDRTKRYYCGHLACQTKHPKGLQAIVQEYFETPATLREFSGEWVPLPSADILRLGENPASGMLGISTILGTEFWCCQHKFRIVLGPLDYVQYESFLPGGNRIRHLASLVKNYSGDELAWDVMLVLKKEEVPSLSLDGRSRLGWTTWLGERQVQTDADDLVLNVLAVINHQQKKEP